MTGKRNIEVFSAGCSLCQEAEDMVRGLSCEHCEITVRDMHDLANATRAKELGIKTVPAVVVNGKLADCCAGGGPDEATLKAAGIGKPM